MAGKPSRTRIVNQPPKGGFLRRPRSLTLTRGQNHKTLARFARSQRSPNTFSRLRMVNNGARFARLKTKPITTQNRLHQKVDYADPTHPAPPNIYSNIQLTLYTLICTIHTSFQCLLHRNTTTPSCTATPLRLHLQIFPDCYITPNTGTTPLPFLVPCLPYEYYFCET